MGSIVLAYVDHEFLFDDLLDGVAVLVIHAQEPFVEFLGGLVNPVTPNPYTEHAKMMQPLRNRRTVHRFIQGGTMCVNSKVTRPLWPYFTPNWNNS